jgi:pimeloyl-ACP methyl ester carboxylesterase
MGNATLLLLLSLQLNVEHADRRVILAPAETVHVSVAGTGEPVVVVPGLVGGGFGFRKVVPLLHEDGFRTHVIELLGTGRSSRPTDADYSLEAQADRVAAVMDSLEIGGVIVLAHAIGSSVAARVAARRPDLISGLVLLEGGLAESVSTPGIRRAQKLAPLIRILGAGKVRGRVRDQLIESSGNPSWVEASVVEAYTADATRDLGATLRVLRAMNDSPVRDSIANRLHEIRTDVLLLLGGAPHANGPPASEVEQMARSLSSFAADTLAGVGHFPQEESPEAVRTAVVRMRATRFSALRPRPAG